MDHQVKITLTEIEEKIVDYFEYDLNTEVENVVKQNLMQLSASIASLYGAKNKLEITENMTQYDMVEKAFNEGFIK